MNKIEEIVTRSTGDWTTSQLKIVSILIESLFPHESSQLTFQQLQYPSKTTCSTLYDLCCAEIKLQPQRHLTIRYWPKLTEADIIWYRLLSFVEMKYHGCINPCNPCHIIPLPLLRLVILLLLLVNQFDIHNNDKQANSPDYFILCSNFLLLMRGHSEQQDINLVPPWKNEVWKQLIWNLFCFCFFGDAFVSYRVWFAWS